MATTITTSGDLIYGTGSGTYTRRGIGSTGNVLTVSGGVPVWAAPAGGGKVLQVINASTTTQTTVASTTYADSTLTATITPTLSTSKILVIVNQNFSITRSAADINGLIQILRGSTSILDLKDVMAHNFLSTYGFSQGVQGATYLDSPATTSATTYKTQIKVNVTSSGGSCTAQSNNAPSTITLLEIGA
jgi:hypothetical protein